MTSIQKAGVSMYNEFAAVYDSLVFDIPYASYAELIREKVLEYGGSLESILDFGVGTGNLTRELIKYSTVYTGIDLSVEMLTIAQQKIQDPHLKLYNCDIRDYISEKPFTLCVSTLDSTNYILDEKELMEVMEKINTLLEEDGLYLFDINSEYKLKDVLGNRSYIYEKDDIFYTWDNFYDQKENCVDFILDFFQEEDGLYRRFTEYQRERIYSVGEITEFLKRTGFLVLEILDFDTGETIESETQRILFIAKKDNI